MFKLLRYFSFTSLIGFIIIIFLLGWFYQQAVLADLTEIAESKNVTLALTLFYGVLFLIVRHADKILKQQNIEREQAEESLRESEERLRHVFAAISDHIYVTMITQNGERINRYVSPTEPLTGYLREKILADWNFWPSTLIHPDDQARAAAQAERLAQGYNSEVEYRLIRADGQIIWVRDSGRVETEPSSGNIMIYGVVSDITERKWAEETLRNAHHELERRVQERTAELAQANQALQAEIVERKQVEAEILQRTRETEALRQAGAALSSTLNYEEVLDRILEQVSQVVPSNASDIMLISGETARIFRWRGDYELLGSKDFATVISFSIADTPTLRLIRESGRPLVISHVESFPEWVYQPETAWIKSYASTPIFIKDQLIGFLNVDSATPGFYGQADAERLQAFAFHAASAIENARLYAETRRRLFEQTLLNECSQDLMLTHDIQAAIEMATGRLLRHLDATAMRYYTYNEANNTIRTDYEYWIPQAPNGEHQSVLGKVWPLTDHPHLATALRTGIPQILRRGDPALAPAERGRLVQGDGQTVIAVPMITHNQVLGYFEIWDSQGEREYDEAGIRLLLAYATQIALAVEHARLLATLEQQVAERTKALQENEERTRLIIETALDAVITMDYQGVIIGWSPRAETTFGWSSQEATGRVLADTIIPPQNREAYTAGLNRFRMTGKEPMLNKRIETVALHRDGHEFPVEWSIAPVRSGGSYIFSVFVHDITEQKQAEEERIRFTHQLRTAAEVSRQITAILDPDQLLQTVVTLLRSRFELYHVHVYLLNETNNMLIMRAGAGEVGWQLRQRAHSIPLNFERSLVALAARSGEIVLADEVRLNPNYLPNALLPDTQAEVAVPLMAGNQVLGVLDLQDNHTHRFNQSDQDVFNTLAGQIAIALTNARLFAEHEQTREDLAQARDQALEVSRLKTQLLAKVSHELRTPLGAILGFTEMLQEGVYGPISPEQQEITGAVIDSTEYLTSLVNELLDQAQIEVGRLKLNSRFFVSTSLVKATLAKMNVLAQAKGLNLSADIAPEVPPTLCGDPDRLQQILVNLVSNAIKFTRTGAVQIRFYCPDPNHWAMEVSDTGPGIPPEAQSYIFEPFRQVDGSVTRVHTGAGLGLSIVKQLVTLMEGQVTLDSELGRGSVFTIILPLTPIQEKNPLALIIEDEAPK